MLIKKMAGYHQYHAVNAAVAETVRACVPAPDRLNLGEMAASTFAARRWAAAQPATGARCGLAYAGVRQEPDDGVLRRADGPGGRHGESDGRCAHRPERSGRAAFGDVPLDYELRGRNRRKRRAAPTAGQVARGVRGVIFTTIQKLFFEERR